MRRVTVSLPGTLLSLVCCTAASADYFPGFTWDRSADWTPGVHGSAGVNNPGEDAAGADVWSYESVVGGGGADSANPWFHEPSQPMVWDSDWLPSSGVWARSLNTTPIIDQTGLLHQATPPKFDGAPLLRWINPVGDGGQIEVSGTLVVEWASTLDTTMAVQSEVLLGLHDASAGEVIPLFETVAEKPTPGEGPHEFIELELDVLSVSVDEGDSIVLTHRAVEPIQFGWVNLVDQDLAITYIPAPGSAGLMVAAGLCAFRRRR